MPPEPSGSGGTLSQIDGRIHAVDIALIQLPTQQLDGLTEPLEMDDLPLPKELDDVIDVRIIAESENVVIGCTGLLLWHATKSTTIDNWLFGDKRLISAILLLLFLHFTNSGLDEQVYLRRVAS